jgi:hypothetical protein
MPDSPDRKMRVLTSTTFVAATAFVIGNLLQQPAVGSDCGTSDGTCIIRLVETHPDDAIGWPESMWAFLLTQDGSRPEEISATGLHDFHVTLVRE